MTDTSSQLRLMAMNYLARREHGYQELVEKIGQRVPQEDAESICGMLDQLVQDGLQDDGRYAEMLLRSRADRGYGPLRIRMEMAQRGLDRALIESVLERCAIDWFSLARQQCEKKFGVTSFTDWNSRGKAGQYLQRRGFTSDQVRRAIEGDDIE